MKCCKLDPVSDRRAVFINRLLLRLPAAASREFFSIQLHALIRTLHLLQLDSEDNSVGSGRFCLKFCCPADVVSVSVNGFLQTELQDHQTQKPVPLQNRRPEEPEGSVSMRLDPNPTGSGDLQLSRLSL
ncbi:hypothetical protein OJAV_G00133940 [Oryzias javanicus]|uniref:Uncharacterized protein n=1 Tax=Oryzias javanicus TaxID=123683 RepID=A0A437CRD6_ORYJA|nr:hypothetical protein OJAV_G00133940 [Oryzias javanicus]